MFGLFRSKKQRLFDKYGDVVHGATMAGAAYGSLINLGLEVAADEIRATYELYEEVTSRLINRRNRGDVQKMMRDLFINASKDKGLIDTINDKDAIGIEAELRRNIEIAQDVLERRGE